MIYDVKMEDFRRKARLVAGGQVKEHPETVTYENIVLRETTRIALILVALNDLLVKVMEIRNDYITAPLTEQIWTVLGQEFGEYAGRKAILVRSLYGLKSEGAAFRNHLVDCIHHLVLLICPADLDIWMNPIVRPDDG